jgi:polar amino acid transport system substrate-binding protein
MVGGRFVGVVSKMVSKLTSIWRVALLLFLLSWQATNPASAQNCGSDYVIKDSDTLAEIAQRVYGNRSQWTAIFYSNQDRLGANATLLVPGLAIKIPCIGTDSATSATPPMRAAIPPSQAPRLSGSFELSTMLRQIQFLTAEGYPPFADRTLPNGGIVLDLLSSSMDLIKKQGKGAFDFQVSWVNDWAAHLNPLLITRAFDAGIPWVQPDCRNAAALDRHTQYKCQKFFFSDPFYESVSVLFVKADSPIRFESDAEVVGKTLCLTKGWSTFDLDKGGRNWLKDSKVTLMQPQTPEDCFRLLESGTVDAIVIPDLTGRAIAMSMGITDRVRATDRPVHIETMHAIVAKTHPHARTILYYINSSLAKLKESGEYDRIVEKHLEQFWEAQEGHSAAEAPDKREEINAVPPPLPMPGRSTVTSRQPNSKPE